MVSYAGSELTMEQLMSAMVLKLRPPGTHSTVAELLDALDLRLSEEEPDEELTTIEKLDLVESRLQATVIKARRLRNALLPVHRLPSELLAECFALVKGPPPSSFLPAEAADSDYENSWTLLSNVCRQWRDLLIGTPGLWSVINNHDVHWSASLVRSQEVPLTVVLGYRTIYFRQAMLEKIFEHLARIEALHINVEAVILGVMDLMIHAAPLLESLTVSTFRRGDIPPRLPLLFAGKTPKLRKLAIEGFTSFHEGNTFENLTHLCLHDQEEDNTRPTLSEFLDLLDACPLLQELAMVAAGPTLGGGEGDSGMSRSDRRVILPYLQVLDIGEWPTAGTVSRFMSHLVLPSTVMTHIWGGGNRGTLFIDGEDVSSLFPQDLSGLPHLRTPRDCFFFRDNSRDIPRISISSSGIWMSVPSTVGVDHLLPMITRDILPWAEMEFLSIHDCTEDSLRLSTSFFRTWFEAMPALASLSVWDRRTRAILVALLPPPLAKQTTLVPAAKSFLQPTDVPLPESVPSSPVEDVTTSTSLLPCPLIDTLIIEDPAISSLFIRDFYAKRAARGCPITRLHFESPDKERDDGVILDVAEDIELLRTSIEVVEVNSEDICKVESRGWPSSAWTWTRNMNPDN